MGKYFNMVEFYDREGDIKLAHIATPDGSDGQAKKKFKALFPQCELIEVYGEAYVPENRYKGLSDVQVASLSYKTLNED